jgi:hypothetical protein
MEDLMVNMVAAALWTILGILVIVTIVVGPKKLRRTTSILRRCCYPNARLKSIRSVLATVGCLVESWSHPREVDRAARRRVERHLLPGTEDDSEPQIRLQTCDELIDHDTRRAIIDYLSTLRSPSPGFLLPVTIERGFVAPLHLLDGLLEQFKQSWGTLIPAFDAAAYLGSDSLGPWRRRQASMFLVWLIWGPSIPVCTCAYWKGRLVLQYGYGDENNSIPLVIPEAKCEEWLRTLQGGPPARQFAVKGNLRLAPSSEHFGHAQDRLHGGLVLEYESHQLKSGPNYYTAYVWVIFVISQEPEPGVPNTVTPPWYPLHDSRKRDLPRWLDVLPFFEHANIADANTYTSAKEQLASKIFPTLQRIVNDVDPKGAVRLRFEYGCAVDDAACDGDVDRQTLAVPPIGKTIRALLEERKQHIPRELADRVRLDHRENQDFAACHLPDMIKDLYGHLKRESERLQKPESERLQGT